MTVAIIFPGQGTQQPGMGAPWRDHPAWTVIEEAEAAFGEPLASLVLDAPRRVARPHTRGAARGAAHVARSRGSAIRRLDRRAGRVRRPLARAGHRAHRRRARSPLDDGVRFAARRAELTQAAADAHPGRMAALLGATVEQAEDACAAAPDACWIANDNAPGQVVIAGTPDGVDAGSARAKELGVKRATPLNVGGAFHTPLMRDAADALARGARARGVRDPGRARRVEPRRRARTTTATAGGPASADHVTVPVRWRSSMETLAALGADDVRSRSGTASMIAGLAKRTVPDIPVLGIATPDDVATFSRGGPLTMEAMLDHGEGLARSRAHDRRPDGRHLPPASTSPTATTSHRGQTVGVVEGPGTSTPVSSPFAGRLVGHARAPR